MFFLLSIMLTNQFIFQIVLEKIVTVEGVIYAETL